MLIVLEGVDKVGKSTLSKKLATMFNAVWFHFSKPNQDPYVHFKPPINIANDGDNVVCDRFVLGERIYAKVKGETSQWKEGDYERTLKEMENVGTIILLCWDNAEIIHNRFKELGETYITYDEGLRVQNMFGDEAERISREYPGILVIRVNTRLNTWEPITPALTHL